MLRMGAIYGSTKSFFDYSLSILCFHQSRNQNQSGFVEIRNIAQLSEIVIPLPLGIEFTVCVDRQAVVMSARERREDGFGYRRGFFYTIARPTELSY